MRRLIVVTALLAGACGDPATAPSASRAEIAAVRFGDILYVQSGALGTDRAGELFATVARRISCDGVQLADGNYVTYVCLYEDGDSDLLPAGAPVHVTEGHDPHVRLTAPSDDGWIVLQADPRYRPGEPY